MAVWMERIDKYRAAFGSAILLLAAFPPLSLGFLVFVALTYWFLSLKRLTPKESLKSGFLFGFLIGLGQFFMVFKLTHAWTEQIGFALVPYILCSVIFGVYHAGLGWTIQRAWKRELPWLIPILWVILEVLRSFVPTLSFPWGILATPLYTYPAIGQIAHLGTIYLVSLWVAFINLTFAEFLDKVSLRKLLPQFGLSLIVLMISLVMYTKPIEGDPVKLTIGQPGVDMAFLTEQEQVNRLSQNIPRLSDEAKAFGAKMLILPEGMLDAQDIFPPQLPFTQDPDLPMIIGGSRGIKPTFQSAFAYDGTWTVADKTRLVPFGEYVPGRDLFPFLATAFSLPIGDLSPAEKLTTLEVAGIKVAPLICFEGLFLDVALDHASNGAQLITILSIDDWYMGSPAPEQLMSAAVWRAIETGLPVVRSASLGTSVAVDQRGRIIARAPENQSYALNVQISVPSENNAPKSWVLKGSLLMLLILAAIKLFRKQSSALTAKNSHR